MRRGRKRETKIRKGTTTHQLKRNCGKKHPSKADNECWELEKNKASCPSMWKSTKSTWRCVGLEVETEMWQPGAIQDKISQNHTQLVATNYWTPLNENNDKSKEEEEKVNMVQSIPVKAGKKSNKWTRWIEQQKEHKIIIDSGATSHFMSEELHLLVEGTSIKTVFLPDNSQLRTSTLTKLPFKQLSEAAREADNLPGLNRSLLSVNRMAEEGYTTIIHPGDEEVTIHKERTATISTSKPPVLQECKSYTEKLWMLSVSKDEKKEREEVQNVSSYHLYPNPSDISTQQQDFQLKQHG